MRVPTYPKGHQLTSMHPLLTLNTLQEITSCLDPYSISALKITSKKIYSLLQGLFPNSPQRILFPDTNKVCPWPLEFNYLPPKYFPHHPTDSTVAIFDPIRCLKYAYQEKDRYAVNYFKQVVPKDTQVEKEGLLITPLERRLTREEIDFFLEEYKGEEYKAIGCLLGDHGDTSYFQRYLDTSPFNEEDKRLVIKGFTAAMVYSGNSKMLEAWQKYPIKPLKYRGYNAYASHPDQEKPFLWKSRLDYLLTRIKFLTDEEIGELLTYESRLRKPVDCIIEELFMENERFEGYIHEHWDMLPKDPEDNTGYPISVYKRLKEEGGIPDLQETIIFTLMYRNKKHWPELYEIATQEEISQGAGFVMDIIDCDPGDYRNYLELQYKYITYN